MGADADGPAPALAKPNFREADPASAPEPTIDDQLVPASNADNEASPVASEPIPIDASGDGPAAPVQADTTLDTATQDAAAADATALDGSALASPDAADPRAGPQPEPPVAKAHPAIPPIVEVTDLDWTSIRSAVEPDAIRARMRAIVEGMEALLDRAGGPGMLFDADRADPADRAIRVTSAGEGTWFVGDLHGDLLALEAALAVMRAEAEPRIVFLGDLFDDEGFGLEVLLRVFEVILDAPERVCVLAGNHDEALGYDGVRFRSGVAPSDFADFLNAHLAHEWIERAGKLAVRLFARAPRALFFPDGLLVAHGGFPLADLHARLVETGDWNDPACLLDFVWTRAHPTARKKMPNRFTKGSQFGREDFAAFCALATALGRPVDRMVRGHDHVEERYAVYDKDPARPVLTTVALSRRLGREAFGPYERVPTLARLVPQALPQVHRMHIPGAMVHDVFPEPPPTADAGPAESST